MTSTDVAEWVEEAGGDGPGADAAVADDVAAVRAALAATLAEHAPSDAPPGAVRSVGRPTPTRTPPARQAIARTADGAQVLIGGIPSVVGRAAATSSVDLPVVDRRASRRHAEVWADGDALLCRDLGSTNGTFRCRAGELRRIGGDAEGATVLQPGDVVLTIDGVVLVTIDDAP